jgi:mono/diheme cytochrome c family protein
MIRIPLLILMFVFMTTIASAQDPGVVARGQAVYAAQKCSACHAIAGKGNAKGALDNVGSKLTKDEIHQWIVTAPEMSAKTKSTRKPPMKSYTLPKEDLDALVAYLQGLTKR